MSDLTFEEAVESIYEENGPAPALLGGYPDKHPHSATPEDLRKIEMEKLFSKINAEAGEKSEDSVRPKRLVDAQKDPERAALVDSALEIVNLVREKAGLAKLDDLPRAQPGDTGGCVLARAFGLGADYGNPSVSSSNIHLEGDLGKAAQELWGTDTVPTNVTFDEVIHQFDSHGLPAYDENLPAPE